MTTRNIASLLSDVHNQMRNIDGLQPQESFNEFLKYLYLKENIEVEGLGSESITPNQLKKFFSKFLTQKDTWLLEVWRDKTIHLSDSCLEKIHSILNHIEFTKLDIDLKAESIKEFLTPQIRKGLGIFLTPDDVVKTIISIISPTTDSKILDPACGSGTFLLHVFNHNPKGKFKLFGIDKNPKMLLLAHLNLGLSQNLNFKKELNDSLFPKETEILEDNTYDYILTNPPFGVSLDSRFLNFSQYETCKDINGFELHKQTSEIIFIEKCLDLLKPGGTLGVVIPKSIATNNSLQTAREKLSEKGYIYSIISLPPETFATTGTQTSTLVLFIKKYKKTSEKNEGLKMTLSIIDNVGFDSTGRTREGSQLNKIKSSITNVLESQNSDGLSDIIVFNTKKDSFLGLSKVFIKETKNSIKLKDLSLKIETGRTPARSSYSDKGVFLVKVGNLTGCGISWDSRDRNFISQEDYDKRRSKNNIEIDDILMTSSAHSPIYIAKKIDIINRKPSWLGNDISYVGEVMLIRPNKSLIDPYILLAFLRDPNTISEIQKMVRGQTAHLHSSDLSELSVPENLANNPKYKKIANLLKRQAELNNELNDLIKEESELYQS